MIQRPPKSTRPDPLLPDTTLFRSEPARGADHPAGYFAAVGDEDLFKHACLCSEALPFKGRVGWGWVSPGLAAQPGSLPALLPGSRKPRGSRTAARRSPPVPTVASASHRTSSTRHAVLRPVRLRAFVRCRQIGRAHV